MVQAVYAVKSKAVKHALLQHKSSLHNGFYFWSRKLIEDLQREVLSLKEDKEGRNPKLNCWYGGEKKCFKTLPVHQSGEIMWQKR